MYISYNWLKEYIHLDLSPEETGRILTQLGLETGGIEEVETVKGGLKGLVIGRVETCKPHPNSDHLSLTTVDIGSGSFLPIVCGAPNVAAGQKVVVAPVGTVLFDGDKSFTIKKSKIRGEESEGMICAEDEIGLGKSHDGIMVLDPDAEVGTPAAQYFQLESDFVFEVDLTPNRIDAASHIGVARDLAAFLKQSRPAIAYERPDISIFRIDNHDLTIPAVIETPAACHRYAGVTLTGLTVKESPAWLQNRLRSIGLNPINNVVDVTNFVLMETGQPLHAFDAAEVKGKQIIVKTLPQGTKVITLDNVERELHADDLIICNGASEPMCIGGVFGGAHSGVKENTSAIFLESAWFDPVYIRKTARRHGLNTDASFRFERGVDPDGVLYALKRAALLIKEVAGGNISSEVVDVYPKPAMPFRVHLSLGETTRLIGKEIPAKTIRSILNSLEINIVEEGGDCFTLDVPPYRVDVQRPADVIEEILRIYGYNNVEPERQVHSTLQYSPSPDPEKVKNHVADLLVARGFYEIWSNSLTKAAYYDSIDVFPENQTVRIFNPLSQDLNAMRQTLLFGGLEAIVRNTNYQNPDVKLFEFGNTYFFRGGEKQTASPANRYHEEMHLALFVTGKKQPECWTGAQTPSTFYELKAYLEAIFQKLGLATEKMKVEPFANDVLGDGLAYRRGDGRTYAEAGMVHPLRLKEAGIDVAVYYADIHWDFVLELAGKRPVVFDALPKFPAVRRDLALLIDDSVPFARLKEIALKTERKLLRKVDIFDVYTGDKLPAGKKSYALSFILRDETQTLTDKVIDQTMSRLIAAFEREAGAMIR
ncbi:MAG TPA: phenylalanine--tRNA ligase subunit beta [Prolixibacteraceae bacterium]|nr:phenylalanine--tRNA ligase subunit beta [Prolixibacteraceae bacterium]